MKFICEFVTPNGTYEMPLELAEMLTEERSEDLSEMRAMGFLVHREELDNKPVFQSFTTPMWNGERNGVGILRYESWDVYNAISSD